MVVLPPSQTAFPHPSYFSVQPALAWILNHYVYGGVHYVWASEYLFPYRRSNPKSSHPVEILRDLYQPCVDRDAFDAFIQQKRLNLRAGVHTVVESNPRHPHHRRRADLFDICDRVDITFFWPLLYVIDRDVAVGRGKLANSALVGSHERLIIDLQESEFALLLPDYGREAPLSATIAGFVNHAYPDAQSAIAELESHF